VIKLNTNNLKLISEITGCFNTKAHFIFNVNSHF